MISLDSTNQSDCPIHDVPDFFLEKWQSTIDAVASIFEVPAGLIMRVLQNEIEVLVSSHTENNPYTSNERASLKTGLYCETVMASQAMLHVPNALEDDNWKNNPDIALNMISYLGIPLFWKEKEIFGTICVLDRTTRNFPKKYIDILGELKKIIESDFLIIQQQKELSSQDKEIKLILHDLRVHQIELETHNEELRQSQAELSAVRTRYFDLYDQAPVGYVTVNEKGLILEANFTAATLLGETRGTLVQQCLSRFILKEDQEIFYRLRKQLLDIGSASSLLLHPGQAGAVQVYELRLLKKDGMTFWAYLEAAVHDPAPVEARAGTPELRIILNDISERKQMEANKEKLEAQNRQLQKSESLSRMAEAIAHTFNNQLGIVIGSLEMAIDEQPPGAEPALHLLTAAMGAANKAAEVSGLMLTYLGQTPGKLEPLDLSDVYLQNLPLFQAAIPNNVVLEADLPTPGPTISANANQMQQVLTNLITNAWEAVGEDGGSIHLRVKTVSLTEIPIVHRNPIDWQPKDNAYACIEVTDTGGGIAENDIEKIFDPFYSSKFTGRGLGLAVVMGIVRAHGGAVTVGSKPGQGSILRVFLPLSTEEAFKQPDKATPTQEMERGGTVLLVDDEEMLRKMAAAMLKRLGFSVFEAKDGVEAVEVFQQHQDEIRCVLTDLTMPRMSGWETLSALRKLSPDLPVILASGYDKAHVMVGDHPELPQVFLGKPYKLKELRGAIGQALMNGK